jgi:hypothetical protein
MKITHCARCDATFRVCERHPTRPWDGTDACQCGAPEMPVSTAIDPTAHHGCLRALHDREGYRRRAAKRPTIKNTPAQARVKRAAAAIAASAPAESGLKDCSHLFAEV